MLKLAKNYVLTYLSESSEKKVTLSSGDGGVSLPSKSDPKKDLVDAMEIEDIENLDGDMSSLANCSSGSRGISFPQLSSSSLLQRRQKKLVKYRNNSISRYFFASDL